MVGLDIYGSAAFGLGFVDFKSACIPFSRFGFQVISCVGKSCVLQPTDDYFNV